MEYSIGNKSKVKHKRTETGGFAIADLTAIGRRFRELRGESLQEELAHALEISQGQLSKIERGKVAPTVEILLRMSKRFGKTVDWILGQPEP